MKAVFVGGCPRSGTTLVGTLLAAYLDCTVTPESQFKNEWFRYRDEATDPWDFVTAHPRFKLWDIDVADVPDPRPSDIGAAVELAVGAYANKTGQSATSPWIDHTPSNLRFAATFDEIERWDLRYVHIVRDGRAIANSIMPLDWGPNTAMAAGRYWAAEIGAALAAETRFPDRTMRVRYEDLLVSTDDTIAGIADFTGLSPRPGGPDLDTVHMPDYYTKNYHRLLHGGVDQTRSAAWRKELAPRQIELFEFASGELLDLLGYDSDYGVAAKPPRLAERARLGLSETMRESTHAFTWVRKLRNIP